jgi:hypothetical protein
MVLVSLAAQTGQTGSYQAVPQGAIRETPPDGGLKRLSGDIL